ncbi:hypothetical protein EGR_09801 [Echinococcus granulosus]|uniref:Uncharacterized protein n=1 Tax=Echinococcus granulosus TaxID=6210 RepID=W6U2N4_ECHGR|nr:hypothetical protein EGR_09801 [Echinococcus granulosus]EUB55333.1 hypothetical protein EGR_09801 [Echinococcus granulosus]
MADWLAVESPPLSPPMLIFSQQSLSLSYNAPPYDTEKVEFDMLGKFQQLKPLRATRPRHFVQPQSRPRLCHAECLLRTCLETPLQPQRINGDEVCKIKVLQKIAMNRGPREKNPSRAV